MADPTKYTPGYDYSAFQTSSPTSPLPATKVDDDLAGIELSIGQVVDAIKDIRRADGKLNNRLVTRESLAADILLGFSEPAMWAAATAYVVPDTVFSGFKFYVALAAHTSGADFATDLAAGKWEELVDMSAILTASEAAAAEAAASAASALAAQQAAENIGFRDVVFINASNSPFALTSAQSGKLISCDTSGGPVTVNVPSIASLDLPFVAGVKKATGDANIVTVDAAGTDEFDEGGATFELLNIGGATLVPDVDATPDTWVVARFGTTYGEQKKQRFVAATDFTAGVSTTITLTETPLPGAADALTIYFDGIYQEETAWSYVAATGVVTFGAAIGGGVAAIEVVWTTPLSIGVPADGSVTTAKLADTAVPLAKMADLAQDKLIGRATASTGVPEAVGLDATLAMDTGNLKVVDASTEQRGSVELATQAEAETGTDATRAITPLTLRQAFRATGDAPVYACRAWVNFNGTGTVGIRASGNVSSITDNGTGDYTLNFATALPDANYSVSGMTTGLSLTNISHHIVISGVNSAGPTLKTETQLRVMAGSSASGALADEAEINIQIFR